MYERGLMYMMLMLGIVAGAGLMAVKNLGLPAKLSASLKVPLITRNVGIFLCLALVCVVLAISIPDRIDRPYYHMIDKKDYRAFVWIRDNIGEDYNKAILDPWKATAFTAITGKQVYTRIHGAPGAKDDKAYAFLKGGCIDTTFLSKNGISVIYTRVYDQEQYRNIKYISNNPDLTEVTKNIYLIKEGER